jgi:hypothetical protein
MLLMNQSHEVVSNNINSQYPSQNNINGETSDQIHGSQIIPLQDMLYPEGNVSQDLSNMKHINHNLHYQHHQHHQQQQLLQHQQQQQQQQQQLKIHQHPQQQQEQHNVPRPLSQTFDLPNSIQQYQKFPISKNHNSIQENSLYLMNEMSRYY